MPPMRDNSFGDRIRGMETGRIFFLTQEQKNSAGTIATRAGLRLVTRADDRESEVCEEPVYRCQVFPRPGGPSYPRGTS